MNLTALYKSLSSYNSLKNDVIYMLNNLKKSLEYLTLADNNIKYYYLYNELPADDKVIKTKCNEMSNVIYSLENTIIPAINKQISNIKKEINNYEAKLIAGNFEG